MCIHGSRIEPQSQLAATSVGLNKIKIEGMMRGGKGAKRKEREETWICVINIEIWIVVDLQQSMTGWERRVALHSISHDAPPSWLHDR